MTQTKAGRDPEGAVKEIEAQAQEPAGPQADLAAWRAEAEAIMDSVATALIEHTPTLGAIHLDKLRTHLAAMPQAQPDAELLKALRGYCPENYECEIGHVPDDESIRDCGLCQQWADGRAAIAQAEKGAAR